MHMAEPLSAAIGVKLSTMVAGFAGGVVSLAFLQGLTRRQALLAVLVGCLTAVYLTPVAVYKFGVGPELENGTAFVLGLCAMNLIPLIKKALAVRAERLADGDDQKKGTP
jgi:Na+/proline symporter